MNKEVFLNDAFISLISFFEKFLKKSLMRIINCKGNIHFEVRERELLAVEHPFFGGRRSVLIVKCNWRMIQG